MDIFNGGEIYRNTIVNQIFNLKNDAKINLTVKS